MVWVCHARQIRTGDNIQQNVERRGSIVSVVHLLLPSDVTSTHFQLMSHQISFPLLELAFPEHLSIILDLIRAALAFTAPDSWSSLTSKREESACTFQRSCFKL